MKANIEVPGELVDAAGERANAEHKSLSDVMSVLLAEVLKEYAAGRSWLNPGSELAPPRPPIVCLCGSTRFVDVFNDYRKRLTENGETVLSIEVVTTQAREDDPQHTDPDLKARLDELHRRKIDMADYVLVVSDATGYFGESTRGEIEYAVKNGKPVEFAEPAAKQRAYELELI